MRSAISSIIAPGQAGPLGAAVQDMDIVHFVRYLLQTCAAPILYDPPHRAPILVGVTRQHDGTSSRILPDERKESAVAFLQAAIAYYASLVSPSAAS